MGIKRVVQIKKLNQALKHDLKLKKVHQVIAFQHSNWMKPYIMLNTRLRTAAKNEFEKFKFKLMNNSVFGKVMENIGNYKEMFSCEFCKIFKNTLFIEHLWCQLLEKDYSLEDRHMCKNCHSHDSSIFCETQQGVIHRKV